MASGIPGFVKGTWELKQRLGNPAVSWLQLLQPSIDMCFEGIIVNNHAYHMLHQEIVYKKTILDIVISRTYITGTMPMVYIGELNFDFDFTTIY